MSKSGINWFVHDINCFVTHILHYKNCADLCPYITLCWFIISYQLFMKMSTTAVGSGTALQAGRSQNRFPTVSLEFFTLALE
jgi:hypothetical protein